MPAGRPTQYTPELVEQAKAYLLEYNEIHRHAIPSVVGLCKIINIAKSTIYDWAKDEDNEFSDIVANINEFQEFDLVNGGLKGSHNPTIAKLLLHKHGHSDKVETDLTSGGQAIKNEWHIHPVTTDKNGEN